MGFFDLFKKKKEDGWNGQDARAIAAPAQAAPAQAAPAPAQAAPAPAAIDLKTNGRSILSADSFRQANHFETIEGDPSVQALLRYADVFSSAMESIHIPAAMQQASSYLAKMAETNSQVFSAMRNMEDYLVSASSQFAMKGSAYGELAALCGSHAMRIRNQMDYVNKIQENVFYAVRTGAIESIPYGKTYKEVLMDFNYTHIFSDSDQLAKKKLGNGQVNTVYSVQDEERGTQRVLKNGSKYSTYGDGVNDDNMDRIGAGFADQRHEIGDRVELNSGNRDVAVSMIDKLFGLNAVVDTSMARNTGGGQASLMDKASGTDASKVFAYFGAAGKSRAYLLREIEKNQYLLTGGPNAKLTPEQEAQQEEDGRQQVINLDSSSLVESAYNLAALDLIVGHVDRHAGNIMMTDSGMVGIDNDSSFGLRRLEDMEDGNQQIASGKDWADMDTTSGSSVSDSTSGRKGETQNPNAAFLFLNSAFPKVTPAFREKIMAVSPEAVAQTLKGLLNPPEIQACVDRVIALQKYMEGMKGPDKVVDSFEDIDREQYSNFRAGKKGTSWEGGGAGNYIAVLMEAKGMQTIQKGKSVGLPGQSDYISQYLKTVYGLQTNGKGLVEPIFYALEEAMSSGAVTDLRSMILNGDFNVLCETIMDTVRKTTEEWLTYMDAMECLGIPCSKEEAKAVVEQRIQMREAIDKEKADKEAAKEAAAQAELDAQEKAAYDAEAREAALYGNDYSEASMAAETGAGAPDPVPSTPGVGQQQVEPANLKYVSTGMLTPDMIKKAAEGTQSEGAMTELTDMFVDSIEQVNFAMKALKIPRREFGPDPEAGKRQFYTEMSEIYAMGVGQLKKAQAQCIKYAQLFALHGPKFVQLMGLCAHYATKIEAQISQLNNLQIRLIYSVSQGADQQVPGGIDLFRILDDPNLEDLSGITGERESEIGKEIGSGMMNTVHLFQDKERDSQRVFKEGQHSLDTCAEGPNSEVATRLFEKGYYDLPDLVEVKSANRDVAVSLVDKLFGFNAAVDTSMAISSNGNQSSLMDLAQGDTMGSFLSYSGDENRATAELELKFLQATEEFDKSAGAPEYKIRDSQQRYARLRKMKLMDISSDEMIESMYNLSALDIIVGHVDRHTSNIMMSEHGVKGIDNDTSFSLSSGPGVTDLSEKDSRDAWMDSEGFSRKIDSRLIGVKNFNAAANFYNHAFPAVTEEFRKKIMAISPETLGNSLSGLLDEPQIEAAKGRLADLQKYISTAPSMKSYAEVNREKYGKSRSDETKNGRGIWGNIYAQALESTTRIDKAIPSYQARNRIFQWCSGRGFSTQSAEICTNIYNQLLAYFKVNPEFDLIKELSEPDSPILKLMLTKAINESISMLNEENKKKAMDFLQKIEPSNKVYRLYADYQTDPGNMEKKIAVLQAISDFMMEHTSVSEAPTKENMTSLKEMEYLLEDLTVSDETRANAVGTVANLKSRAHQKAGDPEDHDAVMQMGGAGFDKLTDLVSGRSENSSKLMSTIATATIGSHLGNFTDESYLKDVSLSGGSSGLSPKYGKDGNVSEKEIYFGTVGRKSADNVAASMMHELTHLANAAVYGNIMDLSMAPQQEGEEKDAYKERLRQKALGRVQNARELRDSSSAANFDYHEIIYSGLQGKGNKTYFPGNILTSLQKMTGAKTLQDIFGDKVSIDDTIRQIHSVSELQTFVDKAASEGKISPTDLSTSSTLAELIDLKNLNADMIGASFAKGDHLQRDEFNTNLEDLTSLIEYDPKMTDYLMRIESSGKANESDPFYHRMKAVVAQAFIEREVEKTKKTTMQAGEGAGEGSQKGDDFFQKLIADSAYQPELAQPEQAPVQKEEEKKEVEKEQTTVEVPQTRHIDELRTFKSEMTSGGKGPFSHKDSEQFKNVMFSIDRLLKDFAKAFTTSTEENTKLMQSAIGDYALLIADCETYLAKKGGKKTASGRNRRSRIQQIYKLAQMDKEELFTVCSNLRSMTSAEQSNLKWNDLLQGARAEMVQTDLSRTDNVLAEGGKSGKYVGHMLDEGVFVRQTHGIAKDDKSEEHQANSSLGGLAFVEGLDGTKQMRAKDRNITERNVATSRVAGMLGLRDLICQSKTVKVLDTSTGDIVTGNLMEKAKGKDGKKMSAAISEKLDGITDLAEKESKAMSFFAPSMQKELTSLQVLDYICGQTDRHRGNFFVESDANGVAQHIHGIDNDNSFGMGVDYQAAVENDMGSFSENKMRGVVDSNNVLTIPHMDKQLALNILSIKDEEMRFALMDLIEEDTIGAAIERLHKVQEGIRKELNTEGSTLLVEEGGWGLQTHQDLMEMHSAYAGRAMPAIEAQKAAKAIEAEKGKDSPEAREARAAVDAILHKKYDFEVTKGKDIHRERYEHIRSNSYYADWIYNLMGGVFGGGKNFEGGGYWEK